MGRGISVRLWLGKGLHKGRKVAFEDPRTRAFAGKACHVKHVTAQCRFRTVVIRTAVALFSHRCRIALLAFALLTFALLSLRTVDPFALLAFALLASHWCRSHFCLSHSCRTSASSLIEWQTVRSLKLTFSELSLPAVRIWLVALFVSCGRRSIKTSSSSSYSDASR